jgi:formate dehydrogenase subunit gamma
MIDGNDHNMPEQGKYNGGQKMMFWAMSVCMLLLLVSGIALWRAYFSFPVDPCDWAPWCMPRSPRS